MSVADAALIDRFLEMMRAEAGAAGNTIAAYGTDLRLASDVLGGGLGDAGATELETLAELGKPAAPEVKKVGGPQKDEIGIEEFEKIDLRLAKVVACEAVPKSDKLLKLTLEVGALGTRTVASGIAKYYKPEEMVGRTVVLVCNLKPVKLRGVLSEGMILCAGDDEGNLKLVGPEGLLPDGSEVR